MLLLRLARRIVTTYVKADNTTRAAAIAWFALASLFPAMLLLLIALSGLVSSDEAQSRLIELVRTYIPVPGFRSFVATNLHVALAWRGLAGLVVSIVLLWSAKGIFLAAERGLNEIWHLDHPRRTVAQYLIAIGVTLFIGLLLASQFMLHALIRAAAEWQVQAVWRWLRTFSLVWSALEYVISPLILFAIFWSLYTVLPRRRFPFTVVWIGALFAAMAYRIVETVFLYYMTSVIHLAVVYGAASSLIALMLWLYVSANIFYLGATLIYVIAAERGLVKDRADLEA